MIVDEEKVELVRRARTIMSAKPVDAKFLDGDDADPTKTWILVIDDVSITYDEFFDTDAAWANSIRIAFRWRRPGRSGGFFTDVKVVSDYRADGREPETNWADEGLEPVQIPAGIVFAPRVLQILRTRMVLDDLADV